MTKGCGPPPPPPPGRKMGGHAHERARTRAHATLHHHRANAQHHTTPHPPLHRRQTEEDARSPKHDTQQQQHDMSECELWSLLLVCLPAVCSLCASTRQSRRAPLTAALSVCSRSSPSYSPDTHTADMPPAMACRLVGALVLGAWMGQWSSNRTRGLMATAAPAAAPTPDQWGGRPNRWTKRGGASTTEGREAAASTRGGGDLEDGGAGGGQANGANGEDAVGQHQPTNPEAHNHGQPSDANPSCGGEEELHGRDNGKDTEKGEFDPNQHTQPGEPSTPHSHPYHAPCQDPVPRSTVPKEDPPPTTPSGDLTPRREGGNPTTHPPTTPRRGTTSSTRQPSRHLTAPLHHRPMWPPRHGGSDSQHPMTPTRTHGTWSRPSQAQTTTAHHRPPPQRMTQPPPHTPGGTPPDQCTYQDKSHHQNHKAPTPSCREGGTPTAITTPTARPSYPPPMSPP